MEHLLNQALDTSSRLHHTSRQIKTSTLQKVYEQVRAATQTETDGWRLTSRCVRCCGISPIPCDWARWVRRHALCAGSTLEESLYEEGRRDGRTITVSQLRTWIDEAKADGVAATPRIW